MEKEKDIKKGSASLCTLEHCKGEPKNVFKAETFEGEICSECFGCVWYIKSTLKPLKKEKISKNKKEKLHEEFLLEEGMESESEINSAKQMVENCKPKSKVFKKPILKAVQKDLFDEPLDHEIKVPKKLEAQIIRLGIEKKKNKLGTVKINQCSNDAFWYRVFVGKKYPILREEEFFVFVDRFNINKEYRVLKIDCEITKPKK